MTYEAAAATQPLRVVIADDEPLARDDLARVLAAMPDVEIVRMCRDGEEAERAARELEPDVLFLDIRMPYADGLQVVTRLDPERMPYVVFVTAFDRYAVEAFRVQALDYVLKPVQRKRVDDALARARDQLHLRAVARAQQHQRAQYWSEIMVHVGARDIMIRVGDIEWVEADAYYARLHVGQHSYLLRERMHVLESNLDPKQFVRVHRSAIVNVSCVRELRHDRGAKHVLVLVSGRKVKASRARWVAFRAVMDQRNRGRSP